MHILIGLLKLLINYYLYLIYTFLYKLNKYSLLLYMNNNYLFVMFQGSGTNKKDRNENTESKFLDKLKKLGKVYVYQDKIHNISYYDKDEPNKNDFESDINISLSYVNIDTHIKIIYKDLPKKYTLIPVGFSAGGYLALYFAQKYYKRCKFVILLDSTLINPKYIKIRLKNLDDGIYPISNKKYIKMLKDYKNNPTTDKGDEIAQLNNYIRTLFISKHLKPIFKIPVLSFININEPEIKHYNEKLDRRF